MRRRTSGNTAEDLRTPRRVEVPGSILDDAGDWRTVMQAEIGAAIIGAAIRRSASDRRIIRRGR